VIFVALRKCPLSEVASQWGCFSIAKGRTLHTITSNRFFDVNLNTEASCSSLRYSAAQLLHGIRDLRHVDDKTRMMKGLNSTHKCNAHP